MKQSFINRKITEMNTLDLSLPLNIHPSHIWSLLFQGHQPCSLDTSPALNIIKPKTNTATNIQSPEPALALAPSLEPAPTLAFKGQNQHQHPESSQELAPAPYAKPKHCYPALSPETSFKS